MKVLFVANWRVKHYEEKPIDVQPSNYVTENEKYWFFKYFKNDVILDVIGISSTKTKEKIEKKLHFHIFQTFKILKFIKKNEYDIIFCHGTDSAIMLSFLKKFFKLKIPKIIVVDISSFFHAKENGLIFKLCQYSSKAFDFLIYHCNEQSNFFIKNFPWLINKSKFIPFGVDAEYWINQKKKLVCDEKKRYIVCSGYRMRDWKTLIDAFLDLDTDIDLYLLGADNQKLSFDSDRIKIFPIMPITEYNKIICESLFSVIPLKNLSYSFGQMTLLQQMALKLPILTSNSKAIIDYAKESKGVIIYESSNKESLKHKLNYLLSMDAYELENLGQMNYKVVNEKFNEKSMAIQIENIMQFVVGEK